MGPPVSRYSRFQALILSLFSRDLYRDAAANWRGIGLLYLLLLLAIVWIPSAIRMHYSFKVVANEGFAEAFKDFPPITVKDGVASSPVEQPYYLRDERGRPIFILDTTGEITDFPSEYDRGFLMTDTQLIQRQRGSSRVFELSEFGDFYVDRAKLQGWAQTFARWAGFLIFPLGLVFSLVFRLITTVIYAVVGMIFNSTYNKNLSFGAVMRLAALATTPVIYLDTLFELTRINIPFWAMIGFALTCGYVVFAVKSADPAPQRPPQYPPFPGGGPQPQPFQFAPPPNYANPVPPPPPGPPRF